MVIWIIVLHDNKLDILLMDMTVSGTHCIVMLVLKQVAKWLTVV